MNPILDFGIVWVFSSDIASNILKPRSNVKCSSSPASQERDTAFVFLMVFHAASYPENSNTPEVVEDYTYMRQSVHPLGECLLLQLLSLACDGL